MTVEELKAVFDWSALILGFLTVVAGVGILITGTIINRRQEEELRTFDSDLTAAKSALSEQQIKARSLQLELLKQGSRENLLVGTIRDALIMSLKPFVGQSAEVRYGRSTFGVLNNVPEPAGPDVMGLANSLIKVLQEAHWSLSPVPTVSSLEGPPGMTVHIGLKASPATAQAANVFVKSFHSRCSGRSIHRETTSAADG
jgi:hypothetical protein